jgi:hypothetical protein
MKLEVPELESTGVKLAGGHQEACSSRRHQAARRSLGTFTPQSRQAFAAKHLPPIPRHRTARVRADGETMPSLPHSCRPQIPGETALTHSAAHHLSSSREPDCPGFRPLSRSPADPAQIMGGLSKKLFNSHLSLSNSNGLWGLPCPARLSSSHLSIARVLGENGTRRARCRLTTHSGTATSVAAFVLSAARSSPGPVVQPRCCPLGSSNRLGRFSLSLNCSPKLSSRP